MHFWGDDWFEQNSEDLYKAQQYITKFTRRWSACYLISKEKYGTIRYEYIIPPKGSAYYNRYVIRAPWKVRNRYSDTGYENPVLFCWNDCWMYRKWQLFGAWVCGIGLKRAMKKWPHLEIELCCDFMFGTKLGRKCLNKYWKNP